MKFNSFSGFLVRPSFLQPLENKIASSAQRLRLDVRVDGNPFPELKWMKVCTNGTSIFIICYTALLVVI